MKKHVHPKHLQLPKVDEKKHKLPKISEKPTFLDHLFHHKPKSLKEQVKEKLTEPQKIQEKESKEGKKDVNTKSKKESPKKEEPKKPEKQEPQKVEKKQVETKKTETLQPEKPSFFSRFKKQEPEGKTKEEKAAAIVKKMRQRKQKKRKKLQRKSLQEYLDKAGYDIEAEKIKRVAFTAVVILFLAISGYVLFIASGISAQEPNTLVYGASAVSTLTFLFGLWTAVFIGVLLIAWGSVFFFLDYRIHNRTKELEEVLPDFLQLASANIAAGMPIDRALWYSIRPTFGVLAKEMEEVAKATMSGEDLERSLLNFTSKYESTTLKRSISILIEGMHSGGEMADLLNKIALNIDELKIMKKEMAANVTTYAIFIIFAAVIISPFLFALATQLLIIISDITSTIDFSSTGSLFTFSAPQEGIIANFKAFSIMSLTVSTVCAAAIVSVIRRGNVIEGVKTMPVYALVAVVLYFIASSLLSGVFSGIV